MTSRHVFIPMRGNYLAVTIGIPESEPRGLVALFSGGGGAPRSFYNSLWTRIARNLVGAGLATVQVDWPGVGDSTGRLHLDLTDPPKEAALAAVRFAMDVTGADRVGLGGICLGGVTALAVADDLPGTDRVAVVKLTLPARRSAGGTAARTRRPAQPLRRALSQGRSPAHRLLRSAMWRFRQEAQPVLHSLASVSRKAPVLVLGFEAERRLDGVVSWINRHGDSSRILLEDIPLHRGMIPDRIGFECAVENRLIDWFRRPLLP